MSVVIWPRHEVFQLVLPLQAGGYGLSPSELGAFAERISSVPLKNGKVRFHEWRLAALDTLGWEDRHIHLYWEMLCLAVYYWNNDSQMVGGGSESVSVELYHLVIFLSLHLVDPVIEREMNVERLDPRSMDTPWPVEPDALTVEAFSNPLGFVGFAQPPRPIQDELLQGLTNTDTPMPEKESANQTLLVDTSPSATPTPATPENPLSPRNSVQYLLLLKQTLPLILKLLQQCTTGEFGSKWGNHSPSELCKTRDLTELLFSPKAERLCFDLPRTIIDSLGLIICGGYSRDDNISPLSSLYSELDDGKPATNAKNFLIWLDNVLAMNETLYPSCSTVSIGPISLEKLNESLLKTDKTLGKKPSKLTIALSTLSRVDPVLICGVTSTTLLHSITSGPSRSASFRRNSSISGSALMAATSMAKIERISASFLQTASAGNTAVSASGLPRRRSNISSGTSMEALLKLRDIESILQSDTEASEDTTTDGNQSQNSSDSTQKISADDLSVVQETAMAFSNLLQRPEINLPPIMINECVDAKLYLLSPYYSITVSNCQNCDIVFGPVFGAVIIIGCMNCRISVICRKLVVVNCHDSEFNIATISPSVFSSDCTRNTIGPYNSGYRNLRHHMRLADLAILLKTYHFVGYRSDGAFEERLVSCWSHVWLLGEQLRSVSMSSKSADESIGDGDAQTHDSSARSAHVVTILPPENFRVVSVPMKEEYVSFDNTPLLIPTEYMDHFLSQKLSVQKLIEEIQQALPGHTVKDIQNLERETYINHDTLSSLSRLTRMTNVGNNFLHWMMERDYLREVLDLIRLDNEKSLSLHL